MKVIFFGFRLLSIKICCDIFSEFTKILAVLVEI